MHRILVGLLTIGVSVPVLAASTFDGTYAGKWTVTKSQGDYCGQGGDVTRTVTDAVFVTGWRDRDLRIHVGADGSINQSVINGGNLLEVKGHISGDAMAYDVTGPLCAGHYELRRR